MNRKHIAYHYEFFRFLANGLGPFEIGRLYRCRYVYIFLLIPNLWSSHHTHSSAYNDIVHPLHRQLYRFATQLKSFALIHCEDKIPMVHTKNKSECLGSVVVAVVTALMAHHFSGFTVWNCLASAIESVLKQLNEYKQVYENGLLQSNEDRFDKCFRSIFQANVLRIHGMELLFSANTHHFVTLIAVSACTHFVSYSGPFFLHFLAISLAAAERIS